MANVPPKVAHTLMRHSTITLTLDRYSHVGLHDTAGALNKLPPVLGSTTSSESANMHATGTDGQRISERFATHSPRAGDVSGRNTTDSDVILKSDPQMMMGCNPFEMAGLDASGRDQTGPDASSGGGTRTPDTRIMIPLL